MPKNLYKEGQKVRLTIKTSAGLDMLSAGTVGTVRSVREGNIAVDFPGDIRLLLPLDSLEPDR